jgi:integrase
MRAWTFQDHRQKRKLGEKRCPWSVGWIDPTGVRRSKRVGCRSLAEKYARKLEGELAAGLYQPVPRKTWADLLGEYESRIMVHQCPGTREATTIALTHFGRLANPLKVHSVTRQTLDAYVAARRTERGIKGHSVSVATINRELRSVRALLRLAHEWGYLPTVPKIVMLREPQKLPRYVSPEDFAAIYPVCDQAKRPQAGNYTPGGWWRALLVFAYMTGWRIGEILSLRWEDVSLDNGTALTRWEDNKGRRDALVPLHPVVVDHLRRVVDFGRLVFLWPHHRRTLWEEFHRIQQAAGIGPDAVYGFHDLRRAFASMNAARLPAEALQRLMRHRNYTTTQKYINMSRHLDGAVASLEVPEVLRRAN